MRGHPGLDVKILRIYSPTQLFKEEHMSVARVTEITASSTKSFDDAIHEGIDRANKTLKNLTGAWIKEQKVVITNGKITDYRVTMKVTFILKD